MEDVTINQLVDSTEIGSKQKRQRSVAYPSTSITYAVGLTERINKIFGNVTYNNREKLAIKLGISESHLQTQLSTCVQYGLLDMKSKEGYKPTVLFTKIYKPLPSENKLDALRDCFFNCELYKNVIPECNGRSLTQEGLATILYRNHKVAEAASSLAAKIFLENANELGLLADDGILTIDSQVTEVEEIEVDQPENKVVETKVENKVTYLPPSGHNLNGNAEIGLEVPPIPIFLDGDNRIAKLYMPKGFTKDDLARVSKVLKAYVE